MGKKYIIEIPDDKIGDFIGSTHFLMPYMMAGHIGHHDTGLPIKPYTAPDLEQVRKEGYEKGWKEAEDHYFDGYSDGYDAGLDDAWKAAKKIWKYDTTTLKEIFGEGVMRMDWFMKFTASEAIEKIRQYEQEKEEIKVGDEVINRDKKAVVTEITDRFVRIMYSDGSGYALFSENMTKTGRTFPEISEVLQKMKESDNG